MTAALANSLLTRAADYVVAEAPRVKDPTFTIGDRETVRRILGFHSLQGTLRIEWQVQPFAGGVAFAPVGLAVVWQETEANLLNRLATGEDLWQWQPTDPNGDCLYLALVLTQSPGVLASLADYFVKRFPQELPEYAFRRGKLRKTTGLLSRLSAQWDTTSPQLNALTVNNGKDLAYV